MRQIRIALTSVPVGLRRLVEQGLADQSDLTVVAVATGEVALLLEAARADVVVVAMQRGEVPALAERLLDEYPHVGVVCVDVSSGRGAVYRLQPKPMALDEISPRALAAAIRSAAEDTVVPWGH
jgi:DNA-binding NarL/FixJ family response regulator